MHHHACYLTILSLAARPVAALMHPGSRTQMPDAVQVSYAIGVAQPLSVHVDTYATGTKPDKEILASVLKAFDFRPGEER